MKFLVSSISVGIFDNLTEEENIHLGSCVVDIWSENLLTAWLMGMYGLTKMNMDDVIWDHSKSAWKFKMLVGLDIIAMKSKRVNKLRMDPKSLEMALNVAESITKRSEIEWTYILHEYLMKNTQEGKDIVQEALQSIIIGNWDNAMTKSSILDHPLEEGLSIAGDISPWSFSLNSLVVKNPVSWLFGMPPITSTSVGKIIHSSDIIDMLYLEGDDGKTKIKLHVKDEVEDRDTMYWIMDWLFTHETKGIEMDSAIDMDGIKLYPKIDGDVKILCGCWDEVRTNI